MTPKLPRYYELLNEAHASQEDMDHFDLDSGNLESLAKWKQLIADNNHNQMKLWVYVIANLDSLTDELLQQEDP